MSKGPGGWVCPERVDETFAWGLGPLSGENVIRDQILEALEILCEDVRSLFCKAVGSHLKFLGIIWIVSPLLKVVLIKDCKPPVSWRH